jgi:hypothetical protein
LEWLDIFPGLRTLNEAEIPGNIEALPSSKFKTAEKPKNFLTELKKKENFFPGDQIAPLGDLLTAQLSNLEVFLLQFHRLAKAEDVGASCASKRPKSFQPNKTGKNQ